MELSQVDQPLAWGVEWAWVGIFTSLATLATLLNILLFFSVARNSFLHYSFHYVVLALALRNICRVGLSSLLILLAKLLQNPEEIKGTYLVPESLYSDDADLSQADKMPLACDILSMTDHLLMTVLMFYLAALSLYLFCRHPNPPVLTSSLKTLKLYGLTCGIVPVREKWWVSVLLLLLPPLMAVCLCVPVLLIHLPHAMAAIPGGSICMVTQSVELNTYQSSVAILGFLLPVAIIMCLIIGLSIRRCVSCSGGKCISSFCKEELVLTLLTLPYSAAYLAMYLPLLDQNLSLLALPQSGLQGYLTPEISRTAEMVMSLLLPLLVFTTLPMYRQFSSEPDPADQRRSKRDQSTQSNAPDSRRASLASFGFD